MRRLVCRNLRYYWRTNLAALAGVATAVAVLSGALLVGESVRASLRDLVVRRLGATDVVVASDRFFREDLARAFASVDSTAKTTSCPIIRLEGALARAESSRRSRAVQVYGVDDRFWHFHGIARTGPSGRTALVGRALAEALGIKPGDDLLLRLDTAGWIPRESLFGRRESVGRTIRLTAGEILDADGLGEFTLQSSQQQVLAVFIPLARLQRDLAQSLRINAILVAGSPEPVGAGQVRSVLERQFSLQDVGVTIRPLPARQALAVESARVVLDDSTARAVAESAAELGLVSSGVFSYLANTIRTGSREIPYSVITAADLGQGALTGVRFIEGAAPSVSAVAPDESIWLNEWTRKDLGASPGDPIEVDYYRWQDDGRLTVETARLRLVGVIATDGGADSTLAPEFPGISDARDIRSWDPPFPMDLRRIREIDEDYWHRYRASPKAFVTLAAGQRLWRSRFGQLSSVRLAVPAAGAPVDLRTVSERLASLLRERIDPQSGGLAVVPVRALGFAASAGSTDFGEYFVYFSAFLIAAGILLAGLFFRLGVEQRVREIGTLQAMGFPFAAIRRVFLTEGALLSAAGGILGVIGAIGYGGILILGLRTWWIGAIGTSQMFLYLSAADLAVGAVVGVVASLVSVLWALRGLRHASARELLAGVLEPRLGRQRRARLLRVVAALALLAAVALLAATAAGSVPDVGGFFGAGVLLLASTLSLTAVLLRHPRGRPITTPGWRGLVRLGARYATYRPGRSLLCVALIAFAAFVIVSVEAFRKDAGSVDLSSASGTGGFPLVARSVLPIVHDPNGHAGREGLGIDTSQHPEFARVRFVPFRERPGEEASCLNLYAPQEPRILGAPLSFIRESRFGFQSSLAQTAEEQQNPWLLLGTPQPDDAIPAIGDANTIRYILHRAVGDDITLRGDDGATVRLRLVAALRDSILQSELIIAESAFLRIFPDREGFRFFLLDVPPSEAAGLVGPLEESLADWGVDIERAADRLAAYHQVENTYLSTFQSLGALGLVLGTIGLSAVLLRNVLERRHELALLRAVGYRGDALAVIVIVEHILLMAGGLACGTVSALLAIVPALVARGGSPPVAGAGAMLVVVLLGGVLSSLVAVLAIRRMPLLEAIRSE
ncbi:MAG: FtsX-like permease family protein [Acidobacteriota bacterium]